MVRRDEAQQYRQPDSPFSIDDATVPGQGEQAQAAGDFSRAEGTVFAAPGEDDIGPDYGRRRGLRLHAREDVSVYNAQSEARYAMDPRLRTTILLLVAAVVLVPITLVLPVNLFSTTGFNSSVAQMSASIGGRITSVSQMFSDTAAGRAMSIYFWQTLAVAIAGAGLALNGAVFQGSLKNALASPSTLGVMSGATLGSVIYSLLFLLPSHETQESLRLVSEIAESQSQLDPLEYFLMAQQRALISLAGCFIVVALVLLIAYIAGRGRVSKVGLLISGQVFTATISGVIDMVRYYIRDHGTEAQMQALRNAVGGSFENMWNITQVAYLAIPVFIGIAIVMAMRYRLNLLAFDDEEARSLGISVNVTRNTVIVVCTVLTAVIVSFVGSVGFVGFIVPHLARKMVGPDFRYYVPASVCLGAVYLLIANYLANMSGVFQGSVGTLTSIIGVVFFIVMAIRQRARGNADWI